MRRHRGRMIFLPSRRWISMSLCDVSTALASVAQYLLARQVSSEHHLFTPVWLAWLVWKFGASSIYHSFDSFRTGASFENPEHQVPRRRLQDFHRGTASTASTKHSIPLLWYLSSGIKHELGPTRVVLCTFPEDVWPSLLKCTCLCLQGSEAKADLPREKVEAATMPPNTAETKPKNWRCVYVFSCPKSPKSKKKIPHHIELTVHA